MFPALQAYEKSSAKPGNRFGAFYVPNGMIMDNWTPKLDSPDYELTPILKSLEPVRRQISVLSGLSAVPPPNAPENSHPKASTRFLTDMPPKPTRGTADLSAGTSMDQILAQELGKYTQLASLELGLESSESAGTCSSGYSCAYTSTISWRTPTTPLPLEHDPRAVFERLFGDSGSTNGAARMARMREEGSLLDSIVEKTASLKRTLGPGDGARLGEYFEAIRDVERRIQKAEEQNTRELPEVDHPAGVPDRFEDHARLMYDLIALAYQIDMTRVITFMIGREQSGRTFPELGVPDAHHALTHQLIDPVNVEKVVKINTYHVKLFAQFLQKLDATRDGDGTLLDHSMFIYGSGLSDGSVHSPYNLPILLVGGGSGLLHGGRHIRCPKDTPLANLHVTLLDKLGVHVDRIGDSTGELTQPVALL
jgi:hypothetical protein